MASVHQRQPVPKLAVSVADVEIFASLIFTVCVLRSAHDARESIPVKLMTDKLNRYETFNCIVQITFKLGGEQVN